MKQFKKKEEETNDSPANSDKEPITLLDDDEDEDVPLAQLSGQKGRKGCIKKRASKATTSNEGMASPVKPKSDKRVRKVKQE